MKSLFTLPCLLLAMLYAGYASGDSPADTLDALLEAGAQGDSAAFMSQLTPDAVVLGLAGHPRLAGSALREFIDAGFAAGELWQYRATQREVRYATAGDVAWFDEYLESNRGGSGWGSGVVVKTGAGWRIALYSLNLATGLQATAVAPGPLVGESAAAGAPVPAPTPETGATAREPECRRMRHKTNKASNC